MQTTPSKKNLIPENEKVIQGSTRVFRTPSNMCTVNATTIKSSSSRTPLSDISNVQPYTPHCYTQTTSNISLYPPVPHKENNFFIPSNCRVIRSNSHHPSNSTTQNSLCNALPGTVNRSRFNSNVVRTPSTTPGVSHRTFQHNRNNITAFKFHPPTFPATSSTAAIVSNNSADVQPNVRLQPSNHKRKRFNTKDIPVFDLNISSKEEHQSVLSSITSQPGNEILLHILSKISETSQSNSNCLVSKRWLNLQGRLVRSVKVFDWEFLISGRMFFRFPNLTHVDLLYASVVFFSTSSGLYSGVFVGNEMGLSGIGVDEFLSDENVFLPVDEVDFGLKVLGSVYPNLRRLVVVNCSEIGLLSVAEECPAMQELVLHMCNDNVLIGIAAFANLQILKLVGVVDGFYRSLVSDRGLMILAQGCTRLVKLELQGCEGGYEGIKAVGECCQMLEELTFCDHRMEDGWLSGVSYCESLKSLKFVSCKGIDRNPGLDDSLGVCPMLERLHLERCQLRDKQSVRALFLVCQTASEVVLKNCWGLNDAIFFNASLCRRLKSVSIQGCSRLTTQGLETVVLSWKELATLQVISCKNIKDDEVTPLLSALFSDLKDFKWCPGNTYPTSTRLSSSDIGKRGGKFFKKFQI